MVLTEDDYLEFLVRMNRDASEPLLPPVIRTAFKDSLLFVGYSLSDWSFRVLFRGLIGSLPAGLGNLSIAVQRIRPHAIPRRSGWRRRSGTSRATSRGSRLSRCSSTGAT